MKYIMNNINSTSRMAFTDVNVRNKKVFIGISGGVDSAVSAALLQKAGAKITGVFIKGWYPPGMPCTWASERRDAMRVASKLHIPFLTLDASKEYKRLVIDYMVEEYCAGRTPNPDIMCNKEVKFGVFYKYAKEQGADAIATGHYRSGTKNQSYFLWAVPKDALKETIFPIGDMEKDDVRKIARHFNLPVASKRDSQGICFLGSISLDEFLHTQFENLSGRVVDKDGRYLGEHNGAVFHTLGERISFSKMKESGPWFVISKDIKKNVLVVGKKLKYEIKSIHKSVPFTDANWLQNMSKVKYAQYRYRGACISGYIETKQTKNSENLNSLFVSTEPSSEIPTPGQSIVFYNNEELVGGGIICG